MAIKKYLYTILISVSLLVAGCSEDYDVPNHTPGVIKVVNGLIYTAYGQGGLIISNETSGEVVAHIFPPREMNSIDDFDVVNDLIFVLDSRGSDYFAIFDFENQEVELITPPIEVEGGPFNGISASNGNLVISGGTTFLNRFRYDQDGDIEGPVNFGRDRGHPDVILSENGQFAFISTDFGIGLDIDRFGIMSLFIGDGLQIPSVITEIGIPEAGLTDGLTKPVGFPIQSALFGDYLLVAHGGGLSIFEIIQEGALRSVSMTATNISGISVASDANNAYVIGFEGSNPVVATIDLTDINNPTITSQEILEINGATPTSIGVGNSEIYIAAGNSGIIGLPK